MKIVKWILIGIALLFLIPILGFWIHGTFFYEYEINQIESDLNKIEGVSIIDIWGYEDITLENISARINIKDKGDIELHSLSSDSDDYRKRVVLYEIGGYSFWTFSCFDYEDKGFHKGLNNIIDISENSEIGKHIGIEFKSIEMVVENYDNILNAVASLKKVPEWNYFKSEEREIYILVYRDEQDLKPLYEKYGVDNLADFQNTFSYDNPVCE